MPSIARKDPSHGPPMAVSSFCPRSLEDLRQRRLGGAQGCRNDERHRSVKKDVSRRRTVHRALSPIAEVRGLPVTQALTCPHTRYKPSYGPQTAVASIHRRFYKESPGQHLDNAGLFQIDEMRCSVKDHVSKRGTVPKALSPHIQVAYLPVVHSPMRSQTRSNPYGSKMAVSFNIPRSHRRSRDRGLEVSIRRSSDAVHVKCSNSNDISKAKSNTLLAFVLDLSTCLYSPGTVPRASDPQAGTEKVGERLGECYPPRNEGGVRET
jgi:hypothetical protein